MSEGYVEFHDLPVLRVRADRNGSGPAAAFHILESKLPTLKGRRFYGTFRRTSDGKEYYACVARIDSDDPERMGLGTAVIPSGWYARRTLPEWESHLSEIPRLFQEMLDEEDVDTTRPSVEFYRSQQELRLLLPVRLPARVGKPPGPG